MLGYTCSLLEKLLANNMEGHSEEDLTRNKFIHKLLPSLIINMFSGKVGVGLLGMCFTDA